MSKYFEAFKRSADQAAAGGSRRTGELREDPYQAAYLTPVPAVHAVAARLSRARAIQRITERIAPAATIRKPVRMLISGCRPGDGASSIAVALGVDLSQRLGMRTLLVDAHLRHPALRQLLGQAGMNDSRIVAEAAGGNFVVRTGLARMELATCVASVPERMAEVAGELDLLISDYPVAIVDLGVLRLDPAALGLAREDDPIVLVARYGHTERSDLTTTVRALSAANRAVAGVVLNSKRNPVPRLVRNFIGTGDTSEA
jgi:Mrp family chromosome partitioning ATPase